MLFVVCWFFSTHRMSNTSNPDCLQRLKRVLKKNTTWLALTADRKTLHNASTRFLLSRLWQETDSDEIQFCLKKRRKITTMNWILSLTCMYLADWCFGSREVQWGQYGAKTEWHKIPEVCKSLECVNFGQSKQVKIGWNSFGMKILEVFERLECATHQCFVSSSIQEGGDGT